MGLLIVDLSAPGILQRPIPAVMWASARTAQAAGDLATSADIAAAEAAAARNDSSSY